MLYYRHRSSFPRFLPMAGPFRPMLFDGLGTITLVRLSALPLAYDLSMLIAVFLSFTGHKYLPALLSIIDDFPAAPKALRNLLNEMGNRKGDGVR